MKDFIILALVFLMTTLYGAVFWLCVGVLLLKNGLKDSKDKNVSFYLTSKIFIASIGSFFLGFSIIYFIITGVY